MLDMTLGNAPITLGEFLSIVALMTTILYFFTNITMGRIIGLFGIVTLWTLCIIVAIGIPIGLGIKFVLWLFE